MAKSAENLAARLNCGVRCEVTIFAGLFFEISGSLTRTLRKGDLGFPAENSFRFRNVQADSVDLTWTTRYVFGVNRLPQELANKVEDLLVRGLHAARDVENLTSAMFE